MASMDLRYETMDLSDPPTRTALRSLLESARNQVNFRPRGAKLFIEVYSSEGGGCALYFTLLTAGEKERDGGAVPALFQFDDLEAVVQGAAAVHRLYGCRIYKSSLYRMKDGYRLMIVPLDYADRLSEYFLAEYGRPAGKGDLAAALVEEHGKELIRDNAIEVLAGLEAD
jgi:hypothetical protein